MKTYARFVFAFIVASIFLLTGCGGGGGGSSANNFTVTVSGY